MYDRQRLDQLMDAGFKTRNEQEYQAWKESQFKPWWETNKDNLTEKEREFVADRGRKLHEKKQAWWASHRQYTPKPSYIFQDELAQALTRYLNALTRQIESQTRP